MLKKNISFQEPTRPLLLSHFILAVYFSFACFFKKNLIMTLKKIEPRCLNVLNGTYFTLRLIINVMVQCLCTYLKSIY